nr:type II toxin-antitoxin system YhaV family toxin [uncultured Enterobacter sp.]
MDFPVDLYGWKIYAHPCFKHQYDELTAKVEALKKKAGNTTDYQKKKETKILAHMLKSIVAITCDPRSPAFRPGNSIGENYVKWSRVKFGNGRYRLFFRYDYNAKVVVLAWVNDEGTLRTYGSKKDAYKIFAQMLDGGNPPGEWAELLKACSS